MNDETTTLDQADEDILTCTVSDEALEAAAGTTPMGFTDHTTCIVGANGCRYFTIGPCD
jgi:hypothetical protein